MRYLSLIILIALSLGTLFFYVKPRYDATKETREQIAAYSANLDTAEKLRTSREELITKYNAISKGNLDSLKALLPDSVDNIRLIIQIDSLASRNGLSTVRNVEYQVDQDIASQTSQLQSRKDSDKLYSEFVISFQTTGQYKNFLSFLSDLEENLRLVDVARIEFRPMSEATALTGNMVYTVTITTYWLKQ